MEVSEIATAILSGIDSGNWALVASGAVLLVVFVVRRHGARVMPALGDPRLGSAMAIASSVVGAVVTALLAGQALTVGLLLRAALVGLGASGLWSGAKELAKSSGAAAASKINSDLDAAKALRIVRGPNEP